jgi:hypothetical protein
VLVATVLSTSIQAIATLFTAVGAIAAWRAASASERTSRDARTALAIGIRPGR